MIKNLIKIKYDNLRIFYVNGTKDEFLKGEFFLIEDKKIILIYKNNGKIFIQLNNVLKYYVK